MCVSLQFFDLDLLWPAKRVLSVELRLASDSKIIVRPEKWAKDIYTLSVVDMHLELSYINLEPLIRGNWYESIDNGGLLRAFRYGRSAQFSLPKGTKTHFLNNCLSFANLPSFVSMVLIPEAKYNGNYSSPYVYHNSGLKTINVFCNGKQLTDNQYMTDMDLDDFDSSHCHFLYRQFVKLMCKNSFVSGNFTLHHSKKHPDQVYKCKWQQP